MTLLIAALIIGAAATAGAGILGRANQRQEARQTAQHNIDTINAQTETSLGTMEKDLTLQKDTDAKKANQIERAAIDDNTANMQSAYIEQLAAESSHVDLIESSMQDIGGATAKQGASGSRIDSTLGSIMTSQANKKIADSRAAIDRSAQTQAGVGAMNIAEAKTQAGEIRARYDEGSAFMDLYNYKRQRISAEAGLQTDFYEGVKKDNEYNLGWFMADVFGVAGAAAGAVQSAYGAGVIGKGGTSKPYDFTKGYEY